MILNGEDIWGLFYEPEIQKNDQDVIQFVDQSYEHEVVSWFFVLNNQDLKDTIVHVSV